MVTRSVTLGMGKPISAVNDDHVGELCGGQLVQQGLTSLRPWCVQGAGPRGAMDGPKVEAAGFIDGALHGLDEVEE